MGIFKGWYISLWILRFLLIISQNNYQQISIKYSKCFTKTNYNKNSIKLEYIMNRCKLSWKFFKNFLKIINPLYHLLRGWICNYCQIIVCTYSLQIGIIECASCEYFIGDRKIPCITLQFSNLPCFPSYWWYRSKLWFFSKGV